MANPSIGMLVADALTHRFKISEDPFKSMIFNEMCGLPRVTYRQYLDRARVNVYGETIPRIAIVRDNIERLGPTRLDPNRLPA